MNGFLKILQFLSFLLSIQCMKRWGLPAMPSTGQICFCACLHHQASIIWLVNTVMLALISISVLISSPSVNLHKQHWYQNTQRWIVLSVLSLLSKHQDNVLMCVHSAVITKHPINDQDLITHVHAYIINCLSHFCGRFCNFTNFDTL